MFCCSFMLMTSSDAFSAVEAADGQAAREELEAIRIDLLYRNAQRTFQRGEFLTALPLLQRYIQVSADYEDETGRLFGVIDQIAQIYIREMRDPDKAIQFFSRIDDDPRLTNAQRDAVKGWISAAEDWKRTRAEIGTKNLSAGQLFSTATRYYRRALRAPGSPAARADLIIATRYLLPFIQEHDDDPRIGDALYMMGYARSYSLIDLEYWSENQYLRQVIHRFPHTDLARKAWQRLRDSATERYKRAGHDELPPSILQMLETYRALAMGDES